MTQMSSRSRKAAKRKMRTSLIIEWKEGRDVFLRLGPCWLGGEGVVLWDGSKY